MCNTKLVSCRPWDMPWWAVAAAWMARDRAVLAERLGIIRKIRWTLRDLIVSNHIHTKLQSSSVYATTTTPSYRPLFQENQYEKGRRIWILIKQEMIGWLPHQLNDTQIICTSFQRDNYASTPSLNFYGPGALSAKPTNSIKTLKAIDHATAKKLSKKYWRQRAREKK